MVLLLKFDSQTAQVFVGGVAAVWTTAGGTKNKDSDNKERQDRATSTAKLQCKQFSFWKRNWL